MSRKYSKIVRREGEVEHLACGHVFYSWRSKNRKATRRRCYQCEWEQEQYEEERVSLADLGG